MRGTLQALAFCHSRNVSHGSMGSGSVLLSTFDDRRANDLIVKLDNFGFGRAHYACSLDLKGGTVLARHQTVSRFSRPVQQNNAYCPLVAAALNAVLLLCCQTLETIRRQTCIVLLYANMR